MYIIYATIFYIFAYLQTKLILRHGCMYFPGIYMCESELVSKYKHVHSLYIFICVLHIFRQKGSFDVWMCMPLRMDMYRSKRFTNYLLMHGYIYFSYIYTWVDIVRMNAYFSYLSFLVWNLCIYILNMYACEYRCSLHCLLYDPGLLHCRSLGMLLSL